MSCRVTNATGSDVTLPPPTACVIPAGHSTVLPLSVAEAQALLGAYPLTIGDASEVVPGGNAAPQPRPPAVVVPPPWAFRVRLPSGDDVEIDTMSGPSAAVDDSGRLRAHAALSHTVSFTGTAPETGDVVRSTGSACALAQADSAANCAGSFGVRVGTTAVTEISAAPYVNFEVVPVLGSPCYLSATAAGKLTHTASDSAIIMPPDLVVAEVISATAPYRARVARNYGVTSQLTLKDALTRRAISLSGMTPGRINVMHEPFENLATVSAYPGVQRGVLGGASTTSTLPSRVKLLNTWSIPALLKGGAVGISAQRWYVRLAAAITTPGLSGISMVMMRSAGIHATAETIELGLNTSVASPYRNVFAWGDYDYRDGHAARLNVQDLGACDSALHVAEFWSSGDGNCHVRWDESNTTRWDFALTASARTEMPSLLIGMTNPYAEIDDLFIATEQP